MRQTRVRKRSSSSENSAVRPPFTRRLLVLAAALTCVTGCGEGSNEEISPTQSEDSSDDVSILDVAEDITNSLDSTAKDSEFNDAERTDTREDSSADSTVTGPDTGPPVGDGSIGSACFKDDQCDGEDGVCLDWNDGYCTAIGCPALVDCPSDSTCITYSQQTNLCVRKCEQQNDCRIGYGCKPVDSTDGSMELACINLDGEVAALGGPCGADTDCAEALTCLGFVSDGYCTQAECSASTSCPNGASCVTYNGIATCLRTCAELNDCLIDGATERTCGPLLDITGNVQSVCIANNGGESVGSECTVDTDCASNECRILATGKCVASDVGCFSDADCPGAGVCELAPAYVVGVCTQTCDAGTPCPGTSKCVQSSPEDAWCQSPCSGFNDTNACEINLGETCVFGDPLGDTTGGGTYACIIQKAGSPGAECNADSDCSTGTCLGMPGGTCAPPCGDALFCPFSTVCVEYGSEAKCMKRCFSVIDCPGEMTCQSTLSSPAKICVPPQ